MYITKKCKKSNIVKNLTHELFQSDLWRTSHENSINGKQKYAKNHKAAKGYLITPAASALNVSTRSLFKLPRFAFK